MNEWQMGLIRTGSDAQALLEQLVQEAGSAAQALRLDQI